MKCAQLQLNDPTAQRLSSRHLEAPNALLAHAGTDHASLRDRRVFELLQTRVMRLSAHVDHRCPTSLGKEISLVLCSISTFSARGTS